MKLFSTLMLMGITSLYSADNWVPMPPADITSTTVGSFPLVSCSRSPTPGFFLATWGTTEVLRFSTPLYALYDESTKLWSAANPIFNTSQNSLGVVTTCMGSTFALVSWVDSTATSTTPFTTNFDGSSFTAPATIPNSINVASFSFPYSSFDSLTDTFLVTWLGVLSNSSQLPQYTITTDGISFPKPKTIPFSGLVPNFAYAPNVFSASNTAGKFLVVWKDDQKTTAASAYYAVYTVGLLNPWTTDATMIPNSSTAGDAIFPSFDPNTGNFIVTWVDQATSLPTYTIYDPSSDTWPTPPTQIPGSGPSVASARGLVAVTSSLDTTTKKLLFTWLDSTELPFYTFYDGSMVSPWASLPYPQEIPASSDANSTPFSAFDGGTDTFMVTWTQNGFFPTSQPIYDTLILASKIPTQTTVTTKPSSAANKSRVDIKIQVTTMNQGIPAGSVHLKINGKTFGTAKLDKFGVAHFITCNLHVGDRIRAVYNGNGNFLPSSGVLIVN